MLRRDTALAFAGGMWVFPGGRVDPGDRPPGVDPATADDAAALEAARQAAVRETKEEAGLVVRADALVWFANWAPATREFTRRFADLVSSARRVHPRRGPDRRREIHARYEWTTPASRASSVTVRARSLLPPTWVTLAGILRLGDHVGEHLDALPRRASPFAT